MRHAHPTRKIVGPLASWPDPQPHMTAAYYNKQRNINGKSDSWELSDDDGHDPHDPRGGARMTALRHEYAWPSSMLTPSTPTTTVNHRGLAADGAIVWLHGPEPLGPRGGERWAVRTQTRNFNRDHGPRSWCWDRGCAIFRTEVEARACFHRETQT